LVNRHGVALGLLGCCIRSPANAFPKHIIYDHTATLTRHSFPKALDTARLGCCMSFLEQSTPRHGAQYTHLLVSEFDMFLLHTVLSRLWPSAQIIHRTVIFLHRFCADRIYAAFSMSAWGAHGARVLMQSPAPFLQAPGKRQIDEYYKFGIVRNLQDMSDIIQAAQQAIDEGQAETWQLRLHGKRGLEWIISLDCHFSDEHRWHLELEMPQRSPTIQPAG